FEFFLVCVFEAPVRLPSPPVPCAVCASRLFLSRPASRLFPEPCPSTCRACSQISLLFSISRLQRSRQKRAPVLIFFLILRCNVFFLSCPYSPKTVNFVTPVLGVQSIICEPEHYIQIHYASVPCCPHPRSTSNSQP